MGAGIRSFRDLRVWQAGMELVEQVYLLTRTFPKPETYGLTLQIQRAAVSIPSNIAEGQSREHGKEYLHHLSMAQGSLAELQTQLEIAGRLGYVQAEPLSQALDRATSLAKQLRALRKALAKSLTPKTQNPTPNT